MEDIQQTDDNESSPITCKERNGKVEISDTSGADKKTTKEFLLKVTGSKDFAIAKFLLLQNSNILKDNGLDQEKSVQTNIALLREIEPQNVTQGLLATQMIATHTLAMEMLRRAGHEKQTFAGVDANISRANKLLKTFTAQVEAMQKLKGKSGKQKMTVEHVHVNQGGQAIIGTVENGGEG